MDSLEKLLLHLPEPYKTMLVLIVLTGLRIGELLALRWRVVDLKAGTLHICQSVFKGHFQTPKSHCGVRTIPIGPAACHLLESHLQRSLNVNPDDLLFPWKKGKPYSEPYLLQEVLQPAGEVTGLPGNLASVPTYPHFSTPQSRSSGEDCTATAGALFSGK